VAQNIMSATYKGVGGWGGVNGVGGGLRLSFRHNGTSCCAKGAVDGLQTTLQGKAGLLITVMDNWEHPHTIATLLNPPSIATVLLELYSAMKKLSGKADLAVYSYSIVVSG